MITQSRKTILGDYNKLKVLVKHKGKTSNVTEEQRKIFRLEMSKILDIASNDAEANIMKDKLRTKEAKEEDLMFLEDQRSERKGKIRIIDRKYQKTVKAKETYSRAFKATKEKSKELKSLYQARKLEGLEVEIEDTDDKKSDCDVMSSRKRKRSGQEDEEYVSIRLPKDLLSGKTLVTGKKYHFGNQALTSVMGTLLSQAKEIHSDDPVDMNKFKLSTKSTQKNIVKTMSAYAKDVKEDF